MAMNVRELLDKRAQLMKQATDLFDAGVETKEKRDAYNAKLAEVDAVDAVLDAGKQLETRAQKLSVLDTPNPEIGLSKTEKRNYSILRAIRAKIDNDWSNAGLELEASRAIEKKTGEAPRGFYVPFEAMDVDQAVVREAREKRAGLLTVGTSADGGYTVATNLLANQFIDVLRNKMIMQQAGALFLTGLTGNVEIPARTAATTAYWVAENSAPTTNKQTYAQVPLSPNTVGAYTDISRRLLLQSSLDIEQLTRDDIATVLAIELDRAGLHGTGSSYQPKGIDHQSNIGTSGEGGTNGTAPSYTTVLKMEKDVAVANADFGKLAYITNPKVRYVLKSVFTNATYGSIPVWQDNEVNGYPAFATNQVSSTLTKGSASGVCSALFFGNWADAVYGIWGSGIDMLVDPFTGSSAGTVRVVALQDADFNVRHAGSFSMDLSALTS
jgi:HK97 family phage major capsid protein